MDGTDHRVSPCGLAFGEPLGRAHPGLWRVWTRLH
jgi:hypothetical protein